MQSWAAVTADWSVTSPTWRKIQNCRYCVNCQCDYGQIAGKSYGPRLIANYIRRWFFLTGHDLTLPAPGLVIRVTGRWSRARGSGLTSKKVENLLPFQNYWLPGSIPGTRRPDGGCCECYHDFDPPGLRPGCWPGVCVHRDGLLRSRTST